MQSTKEPCWRKTRQGFSFFIRKRELIKSGKSNRNQNACKYAYYQQIILQVMIVIV